MDVYVSRCMYVCVRVYVCLEDRIGGPLLLASLLSSTMIRIYTRVVNILAQNNPM